MSLPAAMYIVVFVLLAALSNFSHAAYPVTPLLTERLPNVIGAGSFIKENTLYIYGGEGRSNEFSDEKFSNELSTVAFDNSGDIIYGSTSTNGPHVTLAPLVLLPDNVTVLLFGGLYSDTMNETSSPFRAYQYSFNTETWSPLPATQAGADPTTLPVNRQRHTAVLATDGNVYITGGTPNIGNPSMDIIIDSWSYNPSTGELARLSDPPLGLFGHTGTALPDGSIIYVGGFGNVTGSGYTEMLYDTCAIYFPSNDTWIPQDLNADAIGPPEFARQLVNNVLGPEGRYIYFFGGDDYDTPYIREYFNDLWILDTHTFTWINPNIDGIKPQKRSGGVAGLLTNEYAIFGFGVAGTDYLDAIDVLKLPVLDPSTQDIDPNSGKWVSNVITGETQQQVDHTSSGPSKGVIAAVVVVCAIIGFMILFLAYRYRHRVKRLAMRIHYNIWNPRTGEPIWAETARLVSKIVLLFLFIAFFVFVIIQVLHSPKAIYTVTEEAPGDQVAVPDVRLCFEGFDIVPVPDKPDRTYPIVECMTGAGELCFFNLIRLDLTLHQPWFMGNLGNNTCYLFLADTTIGETVFPPVNLAPGTVPGVNNGTELQFAFYPAPSQVNMTGRIHISFYPSSRNPIRQFYLNQSSPFLTEDDISTWLSADTDDFQVGNTVDIFPNEVSYIEFQLERTEYLQNKGWNYVGFAPSHNSTPEVTITARTQEKAPGWEDIAGIITTAFISPASYSTLVHREQKIYSLVNAVGFIGGLFGLFVAFQAIMFGYRPRSPFGIVHRWSFGSSISEGLVNRFSLSKTPVPLVNPVHNRYSINMRNYGPKYGDDEESTFIDDAQRLASVEDRMQLLELLFKSYYVDDEVFRQLDLALKRPSVPENRRSRRSIGEFLRGARPDGNLHPLSPGGNAVSADDRDKEVDTQGNGDGALHPAAASVPENHVTSDRESR
ncbi:hypothetical protein BJV82DRAFT_561859 [Fennellomyces sp. T-0311]|nr:hypothetical protein BJV82DRAFT_561859 [Fennellomyces sp. T-0311]